jgi:thiamine-phosphate pyrophosphorylase
VKIHFPAVYPITDRSLSGLALHEQVKRMAAGGADLIQLREKTASSHEFCKAAAESVRFAREKNIRIIINDRVDIALLLRANGVHLGQEDLSPIQARRLLGAEAIIGYSTHTLRQAAEAVKLPIDYLAFGPVFATLTKQNTDPVVGLEILAEVRSIAGQLPLVAIGGINEANIQLVLGSGADSVAVIGSVLADPDRIESNVRSLFSLASNHDNSVQHS